MNTPEREALAHGAKIPDLGPWAASADGRCVSSDDFAHDVLLRVSGDFACDADRIAYAQDIARRLAASPAAGGVQPPEGYKLVAVAGFDELMQALNRAESKGYMPDAMADEWAAFHWQEVAAPPAAPAAASDERGAKKLVNDFAVACVYGPDEKRIAAGNALVAAILAARATQAAPPSTFRPGDRVRKVKGSRWQGRIVGTYSTALTPEGYAVESDTETGSVQIYPAAALELVEPQAAAPQPTVQAEAVPALKRDEWQGGLTNDQLRAALRSKMSPGFDVDDDDLAPFALGIEYALSAPPVGEPVAHKALKQIQQHLRTTSYHPVKDRIFEIVDEYFDGAPSAPAGEKR